ncbi:MAG TPA: hypothetical protein VF510_13920 [Ktedonobacterales bacterium]
MFCLGCGAEAPFRAASCPVCGRSLSPFSDSTEAPRDTSSESAASSGTRFAVLASASLQTTLHPSPATTPPAAVVSATGLPRDTAGRVLLLTAIALAADLLAPWSIVYGQQKTMAANGTPAMALLALFILAALPIMRPDYRARPLFAVAPLAVGAFCLGAGIFYWAILGRENATYQPVANSWSSQGVIIGSHSVIAQPVVSPDFGLYLFLIGGAVLAVVGYQLFLQAALASARATITPAAQPASPQLSTVPSSASMPLATPIAPAMPIAAPTAASSPLAVVSAPESQPVPASSSTAVPARPTGTPDRPIALPGSAAWNEPPALPTYVRPSRVGNGWSRQVGARR